MKKKPIDIFEEHLDKLATTTVEKENAKELKQIKDLLESRATLGIVEIILEVLVAKGVVNLKDFKRVLGE